MIKPRIKIVYIGKTLLLWQCSLGGEDFPGFGWTPYEAFIAWCRL